MTLFVNKLLSSIMQIFLFAVIPFVWWAISVRKQQAFMQWIGLKTWDAKRNKAGLWTTGLTAAFVSVGACVLYMLQSTETAASEFAGMGIQTVPAIFIYAVFNTALPEELLFRGFLLKRLQGLFGFTAANAIQAALFGLLHGMMFFTLAGTVKTMLITAFTAAIAWFMGYINEKKAGGSIIPSWTIHSMSNLFSGICSAFTFI